MPRHDPEWTDCSRLYDAAPTRMAIAFFAGGKSTRNIRWNAGWRSDRDGSNDAAERASVVEAVFAEEVF